MKCYTLLKNKYPDLNLVRCFAHVLNIIVKSGPLRDDNLVKKIRTTVDKVRNTMVGNDLRKLAEEHKLPYFKLIIDVPTRWNSTYLMINSFIKNKNILKILSETNVLTDQEWINLENISALLFPFYDITNIMSSSSFTTIGFCYSLILEIKNIINKFSENENFKEITQKMKEKYIKYFSNVNDDYIIAIILDPRIKDKKFQYDKEIYIKKLRDIFPLYNQSSSIKKIIDFENKKNSIIDACFPSLKNDESDDEISIYLSSPLLNKDSDILLFWNNNKDQFPSLSKMARDYLCIPAASVRCEEMFSEAAEISTYKRNLLSSTKFKKLMCLQSWLRDIGI